MSTTQTQLFPPPVRDSNVQKPLVNWFFTLQNLLPLVVVDTSANDITEAVPFAGNDASGQSNQNMEITYVKRSADANTFTLTGVEGGDIVISAQYATFKIKSDGTSWWKTA
jgi:hypothetical protein